MSLSFRSNQTCSAPSSEGVRDVAHSGTVPQSVMSQKLTTFSEVAEAVQRVRLSVNVRSSVRKLLGMMRSYTSSQKKNRDAYEEHVLDGFFARAGRARHLRDLVAGSPAAFRVALTRETECDTRGRDFESLTTPRNGVDHAHRLLDDWVLKAALRLRLLRLFSYSKLLRALLLTTLGTPFRLRVGPPPSSFEASLISQTGSEDASGDARGRGRICSPRRMSEWCGAFAAVSRQIVPAETEKSSPGRTCTCRSQ